MPCFPLRRASRTLALLTLLTACENPPTAPGPVALDALHAIVDAAHGGDEGFYFLPPIAPPPAYSRAFDATLSPVVSICELAGDACGPVVVSFSGADVRLDLEGEGYQANWQTKDAGLDPSKTYRVNVLLGTLVLGHADVMVVENGSQIRNLDLDDYVGLVENRTLPIRFRIETAPPPPPPGGGQSGELITYNQTQWGDPASAAAALLASRFADVYPAVEVETGVPGSTGYSTLFTSSTAIIAYLPSAGLVGPLTGDLLNPTFTPSGAFGGEVLALQLNVDFSDAGILGGTSAIAFGDLSICGITQLPQLHGMTIREFAAEVNSLLGGGTAVYGIVELEPIADDLSNAFAAGTPSAFAQEHLMSGPCPEPWQPGEVVTYTQDVWGTPTSDAGMLLADYFDAVYFTAGGVLRVGGTYTMTFTSALAIFVYQPSVGPAGPLNADLSDPTSTASGQFGGEVVGLELNIDFSDAGHTLGTSGLRFGDLTLCGFTGPQAALNGTTARDFLATANVALGGGPAPLPITELNDLAVQLNASFGGGGVSLFAQRHLVSGSCS